MFWLDGGKSLAVVFEEVWPDPPTVKPITAYVVRAASE